MIPDSQLLTEFSKGFVVDLMSIFWDEHPRNSKTANDIHPDEVSDVLLDELC